MDDHMTETLPPCPRSDCRSSTQPEKENTRPRRLRAILTLARLREVAEAVGGGEGRGARSGAAGG